MTTFQTLLERYPVLESCVNDIQLAAQCLIECYQQGGTVYTLGNGGSAADASHIVGELMKGFILKRPIPETEKQSLAKYPDGAYLAERLQGGLRAIALMTQEAITTAVQNDNGYDMGPAQQLYAFARPGDVLIGISTSGNAQNVSLACQVAHLKGVKVIGLTGEKGGKLKENADVCICVPERETYKVQELHLPVYHALCIAVEQALFGSDSH